LANAIARLPTKPPWACGVALRTVRNGGPAQWSTRPTGDRCTLQVEWPALTWKEARAEAVNAVAFASSYHKEWFWSGVCGQCCDCERSSSEIGSVADDPEPKYSLQRAKREVL
jgi:hypothetical protein